MPIMSELSDILLGAGAMGAGLYCHVLSRRLRRFTDLEHGVGGAVAVLSAQVDDLTQTLERAQRAAQASVSGLAEVSGRAEMAGQRLELLMASLHDLPVATASPLPEAIVTAVVASVPDPVAPLEPDPVEPRRHEAVDSAEPVPETAKPESPVFLRFPNASVRDLVPDTGTAHAPSRPAGGLPSPPARIAPTERPFERSLSRAS